MRPPLPPPVPPSVPPAITRPVVGAADPPDPTAAAATRRLDERTCRLICPIAAGMVGVCMTGIGLMRVATAVRGTGTVADDLLSVDALLFLLATLASYGAIRRGPARRLHGLERIADAAFMAAMLLLTVACFVITYALRR